MSKKRKFKSYSLMNLKNIFLLLLLPFSIVFLMIYWPARAEIDTQPPSAPVFIRPNGTAESRYNYSYSGNGYTRLYWTVATDNLGVVGYYIYRNGAQIETVSATHFDDSYGAAGTTNYTVAAYDANGNVSSQSDVFVTLDTHETMPGTGRVVGKVERTSDGFPLPNIAVEINPMIAPGVKRASVNSSGQYGFFTDKAREFELKVSAKGYQRQTKIVTVTIGNTVFVDFSLQPGR